MIPVVWLSLHDDVLPRGQWNDAFLSDLLEGEFGDTGYSLEHFESLEKADIKDGGIVIIHANNHLHDVDEINGIISGMKWCLLILGADEAGLFPWKRLKHQNMKLWFMYPKPGLHDDIDRYLINGYPPQIKDFKGSVDKSMDWFFSGRVNHQNRKDLQSGVRGLANGEFHETPGFTQGMEPAEYYQKLASSKIALCPSGPETPDTFRLWEALELGCVPIVDRKASRPGYPDGFWYNLFDGEPPFVYLDSDIKSTITQTLSHWKDKANECMAWYKCMKREYVKWLQADVFQLSGIEPRRENMTTVLMPTSPIPSHPSTEVIDQTLASVRERVDYADIILMIDGVRSEQKNRRESYQEYVRQMLVKTRHDSNIIPLFSTQHLHQASMTKEALEIVDTPTVLFVEHDTPLIGDIDMAFCYLNLRDKFDVIRFSHEAILPEEHWDQMIDKEPTNGFIRTVMWSQRPHLACTEFYRWIIHEYFGDDAVTMIEDVMWPTILNTYKKYGYAGWEKYRMAIYAPDPDNLKRSDNLDGRGKDKKYPMKFRYKGKKPEGAPAPN